MLRAAVYPGQVDGYYIGRIAQLRHERIVVSSPWFLVEHLLNFPIMLEHPAKHPDEKINLLQPVIELNELSVHFGKREILKNLQIALCGRNLGLLGPNGAGQPRDFYAVCPRGFGPWGAQTRNQLQH
jgi:hypothetical protein